MVELLFTYVERLRTHFEDVAAAHELTPVQAKVLLSLDQPEPMGCIAESMGCDPSNITGVVDRLAERGFLTRAEAPADRRVKFLQSTAAGRKLREAFLAELFRDVPGMEGLTAEQMGELRDVLGVMCGVTTAART